MVYSSRNSHLLSKAAFGSTAAVPLEYTALLKAVRHNRYAVVSILIKKGFDLNAACPTGKAPCIPGDDIAPTSEEQLLYTNPLHDSVVWGNFRITKLLLDNGMNVNARTCGWGRTALFAAVGPPPDEANAPPIYVTNAVGRTLMTRLLLEYGADIDIKSTKNESVLYAAACGGHPEVLELLLEAGACYSLEDTTQPDGFTPLMAASCARYGEVTRMLLEMGADSNTRASNGLDALSLAVELDRPVNDPTSTIQALLAYGADTNGDGQSIPPLSWAVYWNNLIAVKLLLTAGANVDKVDSQGATPVETWLALRPGRFLGYDVRTMFRTFSQNTSKPSLEIFRQLLENGADANCPMSNRSTLLIHACSPHVSYDRMRLSIIRELLRHGADVNGRNRNGDTPLIIVCSSTNLGETEKIRIISELIKYNVNTELINLQGDTALVQAVVNIDQDLRVIGILLRCGANINQANSKGDTPLMILCANTALPQSCRLELLTLLSRHRANLNHVNHCGDTALIKALSCQQAVIIKALLATNLNVNQANAVGDTPLKLLCQSTLPTRDKVEIMGVLLAKGAFIKEAALARIVEWVILEIE